MDNENQNVDNELQRSFVDEIVALINDHLSDPDFASEINEYHPFDISRAFKEIDKNKRIEVCNRLPISSVAAIFEHFDNDDAIEYIKEFSPAFAVAIIDHMETDDAVDLMQYLVAEDEDTDLVNLLSPKKRNELKKFWNYSKDEIGSVMSNSFIEIPLSMSVKDAMKKVTGIAGETDYISILYIVDKQKLVGYLKLKQLIIARASETISDIIETRFVSAKPTEDKEVVARLMQDYGLSSMPIIDDEGGIVGIITHDVMMDIIADEQSEDYARFAGLGSGDIEAQSETVFKSIKSRLPWLTILLFLSLITSIILTVFEGALSNAAVLAAQIAVYMPLILGMSGNAGTQSLAVMIRYLIVNDNDIAKAAIRKHLRREIGTGIIQGLLIGLLTFSVIIISNLIKTGFQIDSKIWIYAAVTGGSIFSAILVATILGATIPLLMVKLKFDPAVASGPFISTVSDIIALLVYYSISLAVLLPLFS
ncbi:MAG: magnesium transporter [Candidatus Izemoplasmatales bacterium]|jgi:magnesium transporter|nr:magnesium transporter [Candidatus Izemoplasmatales bacterium]